MKKVLRQRLNNEGIVSIIVTLIMIIVISLVVIGISQVSLNEQKAASVKQLNTTAYYAAQSAVNDQAYYLNNNLTPNAAPNKKCNGSKYSLNNSNVSIICSILSSSSQTYYAPTIGPGVSEVFDLKSTQSITNITFNWALHNSQTDGSKCPSPTNPPSHFDFATWNKKCPSVLLVDLVNIDLVNTAWQDNNLVLEPTKSSSMSPGSSWSSPSTSSIIIQAACATNYCTAKFTPNSRPNLPSEYYLRVTSLYSSSDLNLGDLTAGSGNSASYTLNQKKIDVTATAGTVSQRLVAYITSNSSGFISTYAGRLPSYAIQSGQSICKTILNYGTDVSDSESPSCSY